MKKRDFKALVLMGVASGAMAISANVEAHEVSTNLESTFVAHSGGCANGCGAPPIQQNNSQPKQQNGCSAQTNQKSVDSYNKSRNSQQTTYQSQKASRWQRQVAENDEVVPLTPIDDSKAAPSKNGSNGGANTSSEKNLPRQYRARS